MGMHKSGKCPMQIESDLGVTVSVLYLEGNRREYNISEKQWFRGGSQLKVGRELSVFCIVQLTELIE